MARSSAATAAQRSPPRDSGIQSWSSTALRGWRACRAPRLAVARADRLSRRACSSSPAMFANRAALSSNRTIQPGTPRRRATARPSSKLAPPLELAGVIALTEIRQCQRTARSVGSRRGTAPAPRPRVSRSMYSAVRFQQQDAQSHAAPTRASASASWPDLMSWACASPIALSSSARVGRMRCAGVPERRQPGQQIEGVRCALRVQARLKGDAQTVMCAFEPGPPLVRLRIGQAQARGAAARGQPA